MQFSAFEYPYLQKLLFANLEEESVTRQSISYKSLGEIILAPDNSG